MKHFIPIIIGTAVVLSLSACASAGSKAAGTSVEFTAAETAVAETAAETEDPAVEQETREGDGSDMTEATQYVYELSENDTLFIEKTVFNEDVIIKGDYGQITFAYCDFNANIINESKEGTKVWIGEGNIFKNGCKCIFRNGIKEGNMEYDIPKFMSWIPVEVISEDCMGAATALNGVEVNYDGQVYHIEDAELYLDEEQPGNGLVPYNGQENANFLYVGKWWQNGEPQKLIICEHIPM